MSIRRPKKVLSAQQSIDVTYVDSNQFHLMESRQTRPTPHLRQIMAEARASLRDR